MSDIEPVATIAPSADGPTVAEIQDAEPVSNEDFLSMVRANNDKRQAETPEAPSEGEPTEGAEETPPAQEATAPGSDGEAAIEVNPIAAKPKKQKKTKAENLKGLREALNTEREQTTTLRTQLEEATTKLTDIGNLEEFQVAIKEKDQRIKELEHLDNLMGLQTSKEYRAKYVEGADALINQALVIAKDYGVPASVIKQALETGNRRQLNTILANNFDTDIAVGDLRPIILETQALLIEKANIDKTPVQARNELIEAAKVREKAEQTKLRKEMSHTVQDGWDDMQSLYSDKSNGVDILQEKSGKAEHNEERMVILRKASKNYADSMGILVKGGLKEITPHMAKAFASRFQLAEVAGHLIGENEVLREENAELKKQNKASTSYSRPLASGSNKTSGGSTAPSIDDIPTSELAAHTMALAAERLAQKK